VRPTATALGSARGPSSGSIAKGRPPKPALKKTSRLAATGAPAPTTPEASIEGGVRLLKYIGFGSSSLRLLFLSLTHYFAMYELDCMAYL